MKELEKGMLAKSKSGHDKDQIYVIIDHHDSYVYLADGSVRTLDRLKKKNIRHIQRINQIHDLTEIDDVKIKRILKLYKEETKRKEED